MTTTAMAPAAASPFSRITRVVRLNLANPRPTMITPALILGGIFALSFAIWLLVSANFDPSERADASDGTQFSGAASWIFFYMLVVAVQAMNLTFPLALGYGSTRRDFYLGSALTFVLLSAGWALGLTILSMIETATNGWGVGLRMFTAIYFGGGENDAWQRLVIFFCVMLWFFFVGAAFAAVYVRWKAFGLTLSFLVLAAALVGIIALITWAQAWGSVGQFFMTNQAIGVALWLLVPTSIAGLVGYLLMRRATPRS
ncbi:MAG: ABC transporter permease [Microbacteriaceae bacterium]